MKNFKIRMNLRFITVLLFLWRGGREKGVQIVVNMKDKFMEVSFSETLPSFRYQWTVTDITSILL
jgi:hypothetical protein